MLNTANTSNNTPFYTNQLTPDILACQDKLPFSAEQLATVGAEARNLVEDPQRFCREHPVTAIIRTAVDGSMTRNGDIAGATDTGHKIELSAGFRVKVALAGDDMLYPDGQTAKIITSAGEADAINGTGVPVADDFLAKGV